MRKILDINNVIIGAIILTVSFFIIRNSYQSFFIWKEIEEEGSFVIAKFSHYKKYPKSINYFFKFKYNDSLYVNDITRAPDGFYKNIGKFYKIKYLPKYPNLIKVYFEQEVKDKEEIKMAGSQPQLSEEF